MRVAIVNSSYYGMKPGDIIYNLGVDRIAQYHRLRGDEVTTGPWAPMFMPECDKFYFSVVFTWDISDMIRQVRLVRSWGKEVEIGGPAATFMHKYIHTQTGIEPHYGLDERFEHIPPLSWLKNYRPNMTGGDYQLTFTSRGCPHKCMFCGVRKVEPVALEYDDFPLAPMIGDNNILATSWKHQELVVNKLVNFGREIDINSGFDVRFFQEQHKRLYSRLKLQCWRFAFDTMEVEADVRRVAAMMRANGLDRHQVTFYCLIGFPGQTVEECLYRLRTLIDLGMNPYPMRFWPLNSLNRKYVAPGWTEELLYRMSMYFQTPYLWMADSWENFKPGKKILEVPLGQAMLLGKEDNMAEVKVTLSEEMVKFLEGIYETQQKLAVAAEHINAASEALSKLGLRQEDVSVIVASRAGVSKTAVNKIFSVLRHRDLDAYEILAMFIAAKENIGRDQARRALRCLIELVVQVQGTETTVLAKVEEVR